MEFLIYNGSRA